MRFLIQLCIGIVFLIMLSGCGDSGKRTTAAKGALSSKLPPSITLQNIEFSEWTSKGDAGLSTATFSGAAVAADDFVEVVGELNGVKIVNLKAKKGQTLPFVGRAVSEKFGDQMKSEIVSVDGELAQVFRVGVFTAAPIPASSLSKFVISASPEHAKLIEGAKVAEQEARRAEELRLAKQREELLKERRDRAASILDLFTGQMPLSLTWGNDAQGAWIIERASVDKANLSATAAGRSLQRMPFKSIDFTIAIEPIADARTGDERSGRLILSTPSFNSKIVFDVSDKGDALSGFDDKGTRYRLAIATPDQISTIQSHLAVEPLSAAQKDITFSSQVVFNNEWGSTIASLNISRIIGTTTRDTYNSRPQGFWFDGDVENRASGDSGAVAIRNPKGVLAKGLIVRSREWDGVTIVLNGRHKTVLPSNPGPRYEGRGTFFASGVIVTFSEPISVYEVEVQVASRLSASEIEFIVP